MTEAATMPGNTATSTQFTFSITPMQRGTAWLSGICFVAGAANALLAWMLRKHPEAGILFLLQVGLMLVLWRRVLRPLPSSVTLDGTELVFRDVPSFWLQINFIRIPVVVRRLMRIPVAGMVPEWIDANLTWNDLERGRTVLLATGQQAEALMAWLGTHGVAPATGR